VDNTVVINSTINRGYFVLRIESKPPYTSAIVTKKEQLCSQALSEQITCLSTALKKQGL
jgi:hypothetical protein